ncbi:hypothetical protein M501DRAFT_1016243 [Patellaria atrata CBS 101060]|uniref:Uncharacterized protein n=1 Tax=Patellaria atrata CBS 101060 TaxID=1346257 RepID=A0A9P4VRS6_9PEZI|nr:hypothetical protein M501DRAFT_1016243 [Patellaria atrata CBS 101060]
MAEPSTRTSSTESREEFERNLHDWKQARAVEKGPILFPQSGGDLAPLWLFPKCEIFLFVSDMAAPFRDPTNPVSTTNLTHEVYANAILKRFQDQAVRIDTKATYRGKKTGNNNIREWHFPGRNQTVYVLFSTSLAGLSKDLAKKECVEIQEIYDKCEAVITYNGEETQRSL